MIKQSEEAKASKDPKAFRGGEIRAIVEHLSEAHHGLLIAADHMSASKEKYRTSTLSHTYAHTRTHTRTHTHAHTRARTHTHVRAECACGDGVYVEGLVAES